MDMQSLPNVSNISAVLFLRDGNGRRCNPSDDALQNYRAFIRHCPRSSLIGTDTAVTDNKTVVEESVDPGWELNQFIAYHMETELRYTSSL